MIYFFHPLSPNGYYAQKNRGLIYQSLVEGRRKPKMEDVEMQPTL